MPDTEYLKSLLAHLGQALFDLRQNLGLTQAGAVEIARATGCGINRSQLSNWETGRRFPALESLVCYLAALELNLSDLHRRLVAAAGGHDSEPVEPLDALVLPGSEPEHLRAGVEEYARRTALEELSKKVDDLETEIARLRGGA